MVDAVDDDARRASEAGCFRFFDRVNDASLEHHLGVLRGQCAEVAVGDHPVRAVIEVEQRHVHDSTVNLVPQFKVKGYFSVQPRTTGLGLAVAR